MLTTTIFGLKKPETTDAPSSLRQAINTNADTLEALLDRRGNSTGTGGNTTSATPATVGTGGSVTVDVPANALVLIHAEVQMRVNGSGNADVTLYEDGVSVGRILRTTNTAFETRYTQPGSQDGATVALVGGLLALPDRATASHTYTLRYSTTATSADFQTIKLRVIVKPC